MSALPEKPAAVADVSDALWEAALDAADSHWRFYFQDRTVGITLNHARCLILLGEVSEPVDPITVAAAKGYQTWLADERYFNTGDSGFEDACRQAFAGLTFPEVVA